MVLPYVDAIPVGSALMQITLPLKKMSIIVRTAFKTYYGVKESQNAKKLDNNPTRGWLYQLCVLVYMLFHGTLYLSY
jgi:hypothetical protein